MKKFILVLALFCFMSMVTPYKCYAQNNSEYVKVIYSSVNVYVDTNINVDYNEDDVSDVICQKNYGTILKLITGEQIVGEDQLKYYAVQLEDNNIGYVLCSNVLNAKLSSPEKDLEANAKLAKDANVYVLENAEYKQTLVMLKQAQEIKLLDGYNKNSEFSRIQYKDENGQIVTAYVKTDCIKAGGISRATIGAIIIVVTTISIVLVVFGIKGKNKKRKN